MYKAQTSGIDKQQNKTVKLLLFNAVQGSGTRIQINRASDLRICWILAKPWFSINLWKH